MQYWTH